ncbi:DUF3043 domain-containing protein [Phytoactinopolyspora alkaliphila]|uniref:DUF3043 domain-containing protein n=2 Tax=Phytoactinopolyspora alkaliphila TaxID=1783498 RepID=A0A6N9YTE2_9ACTN|nr:DUF3043 domain-containing protein [Phytoactinopolyspora alkaliphila]
MVYGQRLTYSVGVFRRRSDSETADAHTDASTTPTADANGHTDADGHVQPPRKGRPTPKRSEAEKARKERVKPPLNRREAMRRDRERIRAERARARTAMASGDERYLLKRDQGPERKFLRDYVDARRTVGEFFLPIIIVVLLGNFIPIPAVNVFMMTVWLVVMLMLFVDMAILSIRIKKEFRKRFPDDTGRGHTFYAIMRAMQIRRLRLPKPTVKPGDLV